MVVLDSEYVCKGITEWSVKGHRHGWRVKSKDVGHRDMWEAIFALRREAGWLLQFVWTPSHMKVSGNDEADVMAEEGTLQHPNNKKCRPAEPQPVVQLWEDVGLCPMLSDVSSSEGDGLTEQLLSAGERSSVVGSLASSDESGMATGSSASDQTSESSVGFTCQGIQALVQMSVIGKGSAREKCGDGDQSKTVPLKTHISKLCTVRARCVQLPRRLATSAHCILHIAYCNVQRRCFTPNVSLPALTSG